MADDYTADITTIGTVNVGGSTRGEVETAGDQDWFAVTLAAGHRYRIDLVGAGNGDGSLANPYLRGVYDAGGILLSGTTDDDGGTGRNSRVEFTATQDATYYVAAGGYGSGVGTYTVRVTDTTPPPDDFAATAETTGVVDVGGSAIGEIGEARDFDWFALDAVAGRTYVIDLEGSETDAGTLVNPVLRGLFNADGDRLPGTRDNNGGEGLNSRLTWTATETGTVYVAARGYQNGTGTYTLRVASTDPGSNYAEAAPLGDITELDGAQTQRGAVTWRGDGADYYSFVLSEPKRVTVRLTDLLGDANLFLADDDGNVLHDSVRAGTSTDEIEATLRAGTYYFRVEIMGQDETTYSLNYQVEDAPPLPARQDDFSHDTGTDGLVSVSGSATGNLEFRGDRDWFAVTLVAGQTYRIDLKGSETGDGTLGDPELGGIFDSRGTLIPFTTGQNVGAHRDAGNNSRVFFTPSEDGTFYIEASTYRNEAGHYEGRATGTYTLAVAEYSSPESDDYSAFIDTEGTVEVGGSVSGKIEIVGDEDWFAVELNAGHDHMISVSGALYELVNGVYDSDGKAVEGVESGTYIGSAKFRPSASGTYYIAVESHDTYLRTPEAVTGTYTLSVVEFANDLASITALARTVEVGGAATDRIDTPYARDWFAVTLEAGQIYRFDLKGSPTWSGTLSDPYLRGVYDADGDLLPGTTNDDGGTGWNSRLNFTATEDGVYYVETGAKSSSVGTYRLSVTEIYSDDFAAGTATTGTVAVGGSTMGEIGHPGDRDWFAVTLEAGQTYRIDLKGSSTGSGTLTSPYLRGIYDVDGVRIRDTTDNNGGEGYNSRVYFTAPAAATYYVAASGTLSDPGLGTYTLLVTEILDDFTAGPGTTGMVEVGGSATGEIGHPGDRDWFAVTLEAGQTYRIDLKGERTGSGTLEDPYLRGVYDADGDLLPGTTNDDGGTGYNSRVTFTATDAAAYYVAAGAYYGSRTGTYTLEVEEVMDTM